MTRLDHAVLDPPVVRDPLHTPLPLGAEIEMILK